MASIGKVLLRFLALVYFALLAIFILGYWEITNFAQAIYKFFYNILGIYSMAIPVLCALFGIISWLYASGMSETEDEDFEEELNEEPRYSPRTVGYKDNVKKEKKNIDKRAKRDAEALPNVHFTTQPNIQEDNFTLYFADQLSIKELEDRRNEESYGNLGNDFSTYFGEGKKSIVLPSKTISLQGFRSYFLTNNPKVKEETNPLYVVPKASSAEKKIEDIRENQGLNLELNLNQYHVSKETVLRSNKEENNQQQEYIPAHKQEMWKLPDYSLLDKTKSISERNEPRKDRILEELLENFGVSAKVVNVTVGPIITRYELQPSPGVKISKIVNLADDIALALASKEVRIEAPIPGKSAIGIEIPNIYPRSVSFYEVLSSPKFAETKSKLKVTIGKDIADNPVIAELDKMPHLLVAGATGAGKSVFIKSLICSLLYNATPDNVKFLMIDPKMVEMNQYNGIPHLLAGVVTDPKKATAALKHIVLEMENRYELFAANGVRDIDSYNKLQPDRDKALPYVVVIIDELADLMMVAANEIEQSICRLAQMARAAGIHLVIATQRPSVNVITGVIKANVPSRVSFAVSSQIDSRTILDGGGAEKLLGRGDMLFAPLGLSKPIRVLGCFINDDEEKNLIKHWKAQGNPTYTIKEEELVSEQTSENSGNEEYDEKFADAGQIVIASGVASVSFLQRKLKVGYSRAARLMDMLEETGIVSGYDGNKPRQILMNMEQFQNSFLDS